MKISIQIGVWNIYKQELIKIVTVFSDKKKITPKQGNMLQNYFLKLFFSISFSHTETDEGRKQYST